MTKKIEEIEKELEIAKKELEMKKIEEKGHEIFVFDENDELKSVHAKLKELSAEEKAEITVALAEIGGNFDKVDSLVKDLTAQAEQGLEITLGKLFGLIELFDEPVTKVLSVAFELEQEDIASLKNLELVSKVFESNDLNAKKIKRTTRELMSLAEGK